MPISPLLLTLLLFNIVVFADRPSDIDMKTLYIKKSCHACHGLNAEGVGSVPRLIGVPEAQLLYRLKNLQKGIVRTASGYAMISFAKDLTKAQTIQMAKYLSTMKIVKNTERYEIEYEPAGDGGS